jgi:nitronate monooxygenase
LDLEHDPEIGLMALLPQVADAVRVPVIAAGGIADGRGIAAAFALGASGVQIGTAFIDCEESAAPVQHRAAVASGRDDSTRVSRAFSGRPARGHRTGYSDAMRGRPHAPFPLHYHYLAPLRAADPDTYQVSLYGQAAALALAGGAAERLTALVGDAQARLHRG